MHDFFDALIGFKKLTAYILHVGLKPYAFVKYTLLLAKAVGFNPPCLIEFRRLFN